ncbi:MAG: Type 1 glutamine amidotransferase-like domain-containing protein [Clostridiales bacterium]|nr:Type 1 glutamine amidotransferase-like domain-containing protein [Clostridiales bacterium]
MTIILSSILATHYYDEEGIKCPQPLSDDNGILTELTSRLTKHGRVVYVANDPFDTEHNDLSAPPVFKGLALSGLDFKEKILLDERNASEAASIILEADLVILSGGKILCQRDFFDRIKLGEILKKYDGLVVGVSAGAMNLCKTIFNFPEETGDVGSPLWVDGLGFYDKIIIPHFDGETKSYQLPCDEIDIVNDYIFPMSNGKTFIGIPNLSYILIDKGNATIRGTAYSITDGKVKRIN